MFLGSGADEKENVTMANKNKGELALKIGGKDFTLRASFDAICELEDRLDRGLPELLARIGKRGRFGIKEMTAIFHSGLLGQEKCPSFEELGELVLKSHIPGLLGPAYKFVYELWYQGQPEDSKEETEKGGKSKGSKEDKAQS